MFQVHQMCAARWPDPEPGSRNGHVTVITVNRALWATALDLTDGDVSRLVVEADGSVIVLNRGRGRTSQPREEQQ